jgi:hypothetical protein
MKKMRSTELMMARIRELTYRTRIRELIHAQDPEAAQNHDEDLQVEDVDEEEEEPEDHQPQLRWTGRARRLNQFLRGHEHYDAENIFAMYSKEGSEEAVDEYMHSMLDQYDCDKVDS